MCNELPIQRPWLLIAEKYKHRPEYENVQFLDIDDCDSDGDTLLHCASLRGDLSDVLELLKLGANINAIGDIGNTPLMIAAMNGFFDIAKVLIDKGADMYAKNDFGDTALDWARHSQNKILIEYLSELTRK